MEMCEHCNASYTDDRDYSAGSEDDDMHRDAIGQNVHK